MRVNLHPIVSTVLKRFVLGVVTLFLVSLIIFSSIEMLPGDFGEAVLGQAALPETVKAFREELGLDKPAWQRYLNWVASVMQGDLGTSFSGRAASGVDRSRLVADLVAPRLWNTLFLASMTAIIAVPLSLFLGITTALYRNSIYDRVINSSTLITISFPEFFVAYILIMVLAQNLGWFPAISNINDELSFWEKVYRTALPALTLTLVCVAHMMRMTRAAIINLLASPYIEMARLKGLRPGRIILKHALPNALAPIINVVVLNMAYLVVGVVLVEVVFVYPGLGQLFVDSVRSRDIPVVQACSLIFAMTYVLLNLLADVLSIMSNPRLLHPR